MTAQEIVNRLLLSAKGVTPERLAKAKRLALVSKRPRVFEEVLAKLPMVTADHVEQAHAYRLRTLRDALIQCQSGPGEERDRREQYLNATIAEEVASHAAWKQANDPAPVEAPMPLPTPQKKPRDPYKRRDS